MFRSLTVSLMQCRRFGLAAAMSFLVAGGANAEQLEYRIAASSPDISFNSWNAGGNPTFSLPTNVSYSLSFDDSIAPTLSYPSGYSLFRDAGVETLQFDDFKFARTVSLSVSRQSNFLGGVSGYLDISAVNLSQQISQFRQVAGPAAPFSVPASQSSSGLTYFLLPDLEPAQVYFLPSLGDSISSMNSNAFFSVVDNATNSFYGVGLSNPVQTFSVAAIPEPSEFVILSLGIVAASAVARRRRVNALAGR
jgi:hypothetical protein